MNEQHRDGDEREETEGKQPSPDMASAETQIQRTNSTEATSPETTVGKSESSLLERFEENLKYPGAANVRPDKAAEEVLIQLNRVFESGVVRAPERIDRFEVRELLGRGQFGTVWLAWDPKLKREVAIKVAGQRILDNHDLRKRFQREAELAARLNHPGLVRVFEVGDVDGTPFYVMPVAEGVTLRTWLNNRTAPVPLDDAIQIVIDIAEAMQHGHDLGIIHRDLKPANIMIRPAPAGENGKWRICVLDFGLAAMADPTLRETEGPTLLGTPMYMSPEQAEGRRDEIGPASDLFTLGSLLYELLTGRAAFQADQLPQMAELFTACSPIPPSRLRPECGPELDAVCRMCLQREPNDRYASMSDVADDLSRIRNGEKPRSMTRRSLRRDFSQWLRRPRSTDQVAVAFFLTLLSLLVPAFGIRSLFWSSGSPEIRKPHAAGAVHQTVSNNAVTSDSSIPIASYSESPSPLNSIETVTKTVNGCLDFEGTDGMVRVPGLEISAADTLTVECRVRYTAAPGTLSAISSSSCVFRIGDSGSLYAADAVFRRPFVQMAIATHNHNNFFALDHTSNGELRAAAVFGEPLPNRWIHLACVRQEGRLKLFVDGVPIRSVKRDQREIPVAKAPAGQVMIGGCLHASDNVTLPFSGFVDEFRISRIVRYENAFVPPLVHEADEDTLLLYHCDNLMPDTGYLPDDSGNGHHGVLIQSVSLVNSAALQNNQHPESEPEDGMPSIDRTIAELVISLGGIVEVVSDDKHFEVDSTENLPADPLRLVWIMMLQNENVTDELVERFEQLRSLEGIDLYATSITDRAAFSLAKIEPLTQISLHETKLGDAGAIAILTKPGIK
ncbi:MAG: protein kinase [Planctomycetaceae bacterium]